MKHRATILAAALALSMSAQAEERPPIAGMYGGFGQAGSGSLMADYYPWYGKEWFKKVRVHAQLWTDQNENKERDIVSIQHNRGDDVGARTTTIIDNTRGTSNAAIGAAWCPTFGIFFACAGLAYLADDDTPTIDQHLQGNVAFGGEVKGWRVFAQHYSDGHSGSSETFLMAGKQFAIK